jgi:hypothetical protein
VYILTWELVLIAFLYDLSHFSEVSGYIWCVLLDDEVVVANYILQKYSVVLEVLKKRLELLLILSLLQIFTCFLD